MGRRRGRPWGAAGGALLAAGCRYDLVDCPLGVTPWDGESAVAPDVAVEFSAGGELPDGVPSLQAGVSFLRDDGAPVSFRTEYRPEAGRVRVIPTKPLAADHDYTVTAIDWYALRGTGHWWDQVPFEHDPATTTFRVGSRPRVVDAWSVGAEGVVLAFSEPMDLDTLDGRIRFVTDHVGQWDLEVVGPWDDRRDLVWILPTGDGVPTEGQRELVVSRGATSLTGLQLEADAHVGVDLSADGEPHLVRYAGLPDCGP